MDNKQKNHLVPILQKVELDFGSSMLYSRFTSRNPNAQAYWHYHPEVEIVFIEKGFGNRYVGNHTSRFEDGDLILLGPNVPHFGYEFGIHGVHEEVVVQFNQEIITASKTLLPEMSSINDLIKRAKSGISFYGETKTKIGEELLLMDSQNPFDRMQSLFRILQFLSESDECKILNADGITLIIKNQNEDRINKVFQYVEENYDSEITLDVISQLASMTVPAFCRYFKKNTKKTFTQFVNDFRIKQAIKLLAQGDRSIAEIANEVGFNNFSHFNKQFKRVTGQAPSKYKKAMYQVLR